MKKLIVLLFFIQNLYAQNGFLTIHADTVVSVKMNGVNKGQTPLDKISCPADKYTIELERPIDSLVKLYTKEEIIVKSKETLDKNYTVPLVCIGNLQTNNFISGEYQDNKLFSDGLAPVYKNPYWSVINLQNKQEITGSFDDMGEYKEGILTAKQNGKWGMIDKTGKWIVKPTYEFIDNFNENMAMVRNNGKYGFIDKTGKVIVDIKFQNLHSMNQGLAAAQVDNLWGYIDKTGKIVIKNQFKSAGEFSEDVAPAADNQKTGFIDKTGKFVIPAQFDRAAKFSNGLAPAQLNKQWGFIDKTGKWIIQPIYFYVLPFNENVAAVSIKNKWGIIDITGKLLIPCAFDMIRGCSQGIIPFRVKYGAIYYAGFMKLAKSAPPNQNTSNNTNEPPKQGNEEDFYKSLNEDIKGFGKASNIHTMNGVTEFTLRWEKVDNVYEIQILIVNKDKWDKWETIKVKYSGDKKYNIKTSDKLVKIKIIADEKTKWSYIMRTN